MWENEPHYQRYVPDPTLSGDASSEINRLAALTVLDRRSDSSLHGQASPPRLELLNDSRSTINSRRNVPVQKGSLSMKSGTNRGHHPVLISSSSPPRKERSSSDSIVITKSSGSRTCQGKASIADVRRKPVLLEDGPRKPVLTPPVPPRKFKCCYCCEYIAESDASQHCTEAPSRWRRMREMASCTECARAVAYHASKDADDEGALADRLCSCSISSEEGRAGFLSRWLCLTGLACTVLPCLLCYFPLACAESCCRTCGLCTTPHRPTERSSHSSTSTQLTTVD